MRDCDYALAWKVADRFPELFEFQNKLSLVIEWYNNYWTRLLLNVVISQCLADQLFPFAFTLLGTDQLADRLTERMTNWPMDWSADQPSLPTETGLLNWLTDWPSDWAIDWLSS